MIYTRITPSEAKRRLEVEKDIIFVDVRTEGEHQRRHIKNSILLPILTMQKEAAVKIPDKNKTIFVYCESGARSKTAAKILSVLGYTNVFDMGGIIDWPYEVE